MFSQVIYQLRLPGDRKFFTFKCSVNVTIKKKNEVYSEAAIETCFTIADNSNNEICIYIYGCECKKA